jgi:hypothetical protein
MADPCCELEKYPQEEWTAIRESRVRVHIELISSAVLIRNPLLLG